MDKHERRAGQGGQKDKKGPTQKWKARPDLNTMRPGVVHDVWIGLNGTFRTRSSGRGR